MNCKETQFSLVVEATGWGAEVSQMPRWQALRIIFWVRAKDKNMSILNLLLQSYTFKSSHPVLERIREESPEASQGLEVWSQT